MQNARREDEQQLLSENARSKISATKQKRSQRHFHLSFLEQCFASPNSLPRRPLKSSCRRLLGAGQISKVQQLST